MYRIVPRTEFGLPAEVRSSGGSLRPPLSNEPWIVAHYTGTNVDYTDKVTTEVVLQIQAIFGSTKPFEYNYVIGQEDNDEIYEFAGKFQAAHSAGENSESFGVLFLLGVGESPTPRMIDKWRWLRDVLIFDGSLRPDVMQRMHFQMPGAATACPGGVVPFWPEFLLPWEPQLPIVTDVPPTDGADMKYLNYPIRIFDSRPMGPLPEGDHVISIGHNGLDSTAQAVAVTVTVVPTLEGGFATLWGDGPRPNASVINWTPASGAIANSTVTRVVNGKFKVYLSKPAHVLFDVHGWQ